MSQDQVSSDISDLLKSAQRELKQDLSQSTQAVAFYATQRAALLASNVGQPGFELALRAERDNVALYAGIETTRMADEAQQRFLGILEGSLALGARALA